MSNRYVRFIGQLFTGFVWLTPAIAVCSAQQGTPSTLKPFPAPVAVISGSKQFNAVQLGPNNTFTVMETPKDFELEDIGLSHDGKLLAVAWGSGRVEVRSVPDGKNLKTFTAGTWGVQFEAQDALLVSHASGGLVLVTDWKSGKTVAKLKAELGPRRYDVRAVLYHPDQDWWAYVDGEEGRVMSLSNPKQVLATLGAATDMALSYDGEQVWTVGRDAVRVYSVGDWKLEHEWKLRSPTPPTSEPEFVLSSNAKGESFAGVPSVDGLTIYPEELQNKIAAKGAGFPDPDDDLMLVQGPTMKLLSLDGTQRCEWQQYPYHRRALSLDGHWFAVADFQKVYFWNLKMLAAECK